ncbi:hypothetical protein [Streptomyces sp. I05A-00742]|uniref:hypothetical protein n=1 Tax=Streptomyces sp. I05A-00742 TaxID=2732853 RepID=UPI001487D397|nr:hypothetical protein [Streptomyces sp. I05A-00742]
MIHISETLALQTIEDFLDAEELTQLAKIVDADPAASRPRRSQAEVVAAPAAAEEILRRATERALPAVRRALPSVHGAGPWGYTELGPGDEVPTHLDGIPSPGVRPRRIGRVGVTIADADEGGLFYVETTSSGAPWTGALVGEAEGFAPGTPLTRCFPHEAAAARSHAAEPDWLARTPTTRWTTPAPAGVAVAYGAQLIHGVTPVVRGRVRKFVTDLLA